MPHFLDWAVVHSAQTDELIALRIDHLRQQPLFTHASIVLDLSGNQNVPRHLFVWPGHNN